MKKINPELNKLINNLDELYQPIYGFENHKKDASRVSQDRLKDIIRIYNSLEFKNKRKVLMI